jgi:hypothetical protein
MSIRPLFRVENQLSQPSSVAKVKENQPPVVAIRMDPSCQCYLFAGIFQTKLAAIVCPFKHSHLSKNQANS